MRKRLSIDYTRRRWGHNIEITRQDDGTYRGFLWHHTRVAKGDRVKWATDYGTATAEVIELRPCLDPEDMYGVTLKILAREVTNHDD